MTPTPLRPYPATDLLDSDSAPLEPPPSRTSSWHPVDLTSALASPGRRTQATVGLRSDGLPLLYSGKVHSLAGETEAGKSWCALIWVAAELKKGRTCHYIDFEDDEDSVVNRLLLLGVRPATIQADFKYSRPTEQDPDAADLALQGSIDPSLVIIDGVTEMLAMFGFKPNDDVDVAEAYDLLPRRMAAKGPAVVMLDHVVKDRQSRGRYATGSQHKLSGINGAAYVLESSKPFADGQAGQSRLLVVKDRPGAVRSKAVNLRGKALIGMLNVTVEDDQTTFSLDPTEEARQAKAWSPSIKMQQISELLEHDRSPEGLTYNQINQTVGGNAAYNRKAVDRLISDGYVATAAGPRASTLHLSLTPYQAVSE